MAASRYDRESDTNTVQIWDVGTRTLLSSIESGYQSAILLSPNGLLTARMIMVLRETEYTRWDIQGRETAQFLVEGSSEIASLSFSPDGRSVASSCADGWLTDYAVRIWDVSTGEEKGTIQADHGPSAFSPDGRYIAGRSEQHTLAVWDAETGEPISEFYVYSPTIFDFSPDGKTLAVYESAFRKDEIFFWDVLAKERTETAIHEPDRIYALTYSPDGRTLAGAGENGAAYLWDVSSGKLTGTAQAGEGATLAVDYSPYGHAFVSGGDDSIVRLWDASSRAVKAELKGHKGAVRAAAYSPDGRRIASAGDDGTLRIWSVETNELERELKGHDAWVNAVAFSPDSRSLISGGKDGRILLWRFDDQPVLWSDVKRPDSPLFKMALLPTYPNPFNPETWIPFDLAQASAVTIAIYNSAGSNGSAFGTGRIACRFLPR